MGMRNQWVLLNSEGRISRAFDRADNSGSGNQSFECLLAGQAKPSLGIGPGIEYGGGRLVRSVLKPQGSPSPRGFESLSLRQRNPLPYMGFPRERRCRGLPEQTPATRLFATVYASGSESRPAGGLVGDRVLAIGPSTGDRRPRRTMTADGCSPSARRVAGVCGPDNAEVAAAR
jgi:hypothetical protein